MDPRSLYIRPLVDKNRNPRIDQRTSIIIIIIYSGRSILLHRLQHAFFQHLFHQASPDAKKIGEILHFFTPVFLLCFGMFFGRKEIRVQDAAIGLLFLFLFFRSSRFLIWFEITAAFWAFPYVLPCRLKETGSLLERSLVVCLELALLAGCGKEIWECRGAWEREELVEKVLEETQETRQSYIWQSFLPDQKLWFLHWNPTAASTTETLPVPKDFPGYIYPPSRR